MPSRLDDANTGRAAPIETAAEDRILSKLQRSDFDPVEFLNGQLTPFPTTHSQQHSSKTSRASQIQELSSEIQELLAKLNAHNVRFSNTLTQLTDEILRSGSRLTYEVEILRGDANSLHEILTDTLQEDMRKLLLRPPTEATSKDIEMDGDTTTAANSLNVLVAADEQTIEDPQFISHLRMLSLVKARLEAVINVFDEAMRWPLPPSELSLTSSLISVSAPEPGSESHTQEEKAREIAKNLRSEITILLDQDGGGYEGLESASARVEEVRTLAGIWKGTAEEKARNKAVESLAKIVDERKKILDSRHEAQRKRGNSSAQRSSSLPGRHASGQNRADRNVTESSNPGGGLLRNLQRLRDEIYLE